jgi:hypothetical protein
MHKRTSAEQGNRQRCTGGSTAGTALSTLYILLLQYNSMYYYSAVDFRVVHIEYCANLCAGLYS